MAIEHQPPNGFKLPSHEKLIFLAGPIQGAQDWQAQAIDLLDTNFHVANPRHDYGDIVFDEAHKIKQVRWEKHQLVRAAQHGGIIFWFAAQDQSLKYEEGRAYAQTTRIEFGRAFGWKDFKPSVNISVGIDPHYEGGNDFYIRDTAAELNIPVRDRLLIVCRDVLRGIHG
ncbi:hypothetical protein BH10PAT3_BH10PAT3_3000 [soil metagenome]